MIKKIITIFIYTLFIINNTFAFEFRKKFNNKRDIPEIQNDQSNNSNNLKEVEQQNIVNPKTLNVINNGLAEIIEPLLSAVVNVRAVKNNNNESSKNFSQEFFSFGQSFGPFNNFFEHFNIPFNFDHYQNNPKTSLGSGFIIDELGYIVTNYHVIKDSDNIFIKLLDNTEYKAKIIGSDPRTDLALLKIKATNKLNYVNFGNSKNARVGDIVIAIGNPLGFGNTVTSGIISYKGRDLSAHYDDLIDDFLQTDAAITFGSSGGPLFNTNGEVIGINNSIPSTGTGTTNVGIGFAIPSETVINIIAQLKKHGHINRGQLNIKIQEMSNDLASALNLPEVYGVLVVEVIPGGAGEKAELKQGDVIIEYNNQKILNTKKLKLLIAETELNTAIPIVVLRDGNKIKLTAKIEQPIKDNKLSDNSSNNNNELNSNTIEKSNIIFSNISQRIANKYNVSSDINGIIIIGINAKKIDFDFQIGDIILSANHQPINNIKEFNEIYNKVKKSNKKNMIILIKRKDIIKFSSLPIE